MVLQDLGRRINSAVNDLTRSPTLDEKAFDGMIKEISNALMEADVNVRLVSTLRKTIRSSVKFNELPPHANKKRIIQKAVFDALVDIMNPHQNAYQPKKGKANVPLVPSRERSRGSLCLWSLWPASPRSLMKNPSTKTTSS